MSAIGLPLLKILSEVEDTTDRSTIFGSRS
jgi:hypothetical protein